MKGHQDLSVKISQLILDPQNPRHEEMDSQPEIIAWMTGPDDGIGDKVFTLAKDICEHGLNPADRTIITTAPEDKDFYIVLEGNRRVTALKLLNNPDLAPGKWKSKYKKIVENANVAIPNTIDCVLYADKDEAYHFVEIKHQGQSGGAGTVDWGAKEKARQQQRREGKTRSARSMQLIRHVTTSSDYSEEVKTAAEKFPITTLDRILADGNVRDVLGLHIDDEGNLCYAIDPKEAAKIISAMILDFGNKVKNVRDVINREAREEYTDDLSNRAKVDYSKSLKEPENLQEKKTSKGKENSQRDSSKRTYGDPKKRDTLPFRGEKFFIDPRRFSRPKRIIEELSSIKVQSKMGTEICYPNAAAVLFRSFLEMTLMAYIEAMNISSPNPNGWRNLDLIVRIKTVAEDLQKNHGFDKKEAGAIQRAVNQKNHAGHTNQLNNYVHNYKEKVNVQSLLEAWECYSPLMHAAWKEIDEATKS